MIRVVFLYIPSLLYYNTRLKTSVIHSYFHSKNCNSEYLYFAFISEFPIRFPFPELWENISIRRIATYSGYSYFAFLFEFPIRFPSCGKIFFWFNIFRKFHHVFMYGRVEPLHNNSKDVNLIERQIGTFSIEMVFFHCSFIRQYNYVPVAQPLIIEISGGKSQTRNRSGRSKV